MTGLRIIPIKKNVSRTTFFISGIKEWRFWQCKKVWDTRRLPVMRLEQRPIRPNRIKF